MAFIGVTAHWIDTEWRVGTATVAVTRVLGRHRAIDQIAKVVP